MDLVPAAVSPFKQEAPPSAPAKDRLAMLNKTADQLYQQGLARDRLRLLELELKRKAPSYTSHTCRELRTAFPRQSIALLIGTDSLVGLERWDSIEEIFAHHPFWLFLRKGISHEALEASCRCLQASFPKARLKILWNSPLIPCSSSQLRRSLAEKALVSEEDNECLLPEVLAYIREKKLYGVKNLPKRGSNQSCFSETHLIC